MGFLDFFKSKGEKAKLTHLKNLLCVALADGKLEQSEIKAIAAIMAREGIDPKELERIMKNPGSISFVKPSDDNERLLYIRDLVSVMMVDGHIDDEEQAVCKLAAISYGYKPEVVDALILGIIAEFVKTMR